MDIIRWTFSFSFLKFLLRVEKESTTLAMFCPLIWPSAVPHRAFFFFFFNIKFILIIGDLVKKNKLKIEMAGEVWF